MDCVFIFVVLGIKPRASHMLCKHSTADLNPTLTVLEYVYIVCIKALFLLSFVLLVTKIHS
jgi:hypothetical protein